MRNIYDIFNNIKNRPNAYLFERSIIHLHTLIAGYYFTKMELNTVPTRRDIEFRQFQQWIPNKYKVTASKSWAKIVLENSTNEIKQRS